MLGRIIFCVVIAAAVLAVVLLATVSPLPRRSTGHGKAPPNLRTLTVYIHPTVSGAAQQQQGVRQQQEASALVFRHKMTAGPESTSTALGEVSGFVLPGEGGSAMSAFDTVHLAFDAPGLSGGLCVEVAGSKKPAPTGPGRRVDGAEETLRVLGGTGAFAFARGSAVLRAARGQRLGGGVAATALRLELSVAPAA